MTLLGGFLYKLLSAVPGILLLGCQPSTILSAIVWKPLTLCTWARLFKSHFRNRWYSLSWLHGCSLDKTNHASKLFSCSPKLTWWFPLILLPYSYIYLFVCLFFKKTNVNVLPVCNQYLEGYWNKSKEIFFVCQSCWFGIKIHQFSNKQMFSKECIANSVKILSFWQLRLGLWQRN